MNTIRKTSPIAIFTFVFLVAAVSIFAPRSASALPVARPTPPGLERPVRIWPACTTNDKFDVTGVTVNPASPGQGMQATISMTIRNVCPARTANLTIPWDIKVDNHRIADGRVTLEPDESKVVSAQWTVGWPGDWSILTGNADPSNTIPETVRKNNTKEIKPIPIMVINSYLIDHLNAKNAGASFTVSPDGFTPCSLESNGGASGSPAGSKQVQLRINCLLLPAGGKVDFEGFVGFTLKNHWRVRSYEIVKGSGDYREGGGKGWSWISQPPSGTNPYFKIHLWADGFHGIELFVKIMIEGPAGTDPYR